jgi:hypothetical protein
LVSLTSDEEIFMKTNRAGIKTFASGVLAGATLVFGIGATANSASKTWEYKVVQGAVFGNEGMLDGALNANVADGWEFVSASPSLDKYGFAIMRRAKQ